MAKQLLIYDSVVPVSSARHGGASLEIARSYAFSAGANAVLLLGVEFPRASSEYAIVFTTAGDDVMPAVVLGMRGEQNLYLSPEAQWQAKYVPAFIRRYPFVFSTSADKTKLTLCIDESYAGLNREGRGERLFTEAGKPSAYTDQVLKFLQEFQSSFQRTRTFCRRVKEAGLLEPMEATVTTPEGEKLSLGGFLAVNRVKMRSLDGDTLASLAKTDELELLYLHLASLRNFNEVKDRLIGSGKRARTQEAAAAAAS